MLNNIKKHMELSLNKKFEEILIKSKTLIWSSVSEDDAQASKPKFH